MLGELVAGGAEGLVLIEDSVSCEGRTLLKSFVAASAQRGESVHVFSFDSPEDQFKAGFGTEVTSRILFHDAFRDPLGWAGEDGTLTLRDFSASTLAAHLAPATQGPATVVLDSLSWPLLRLPFPSVCQALVQLPRRANIAGLRVSRLVALLHRDLHQPGQLETLRSLARVVVGLELAPESMQGGDRVSQATVMYRKRGGKVAWKKEYFMVLSGMILKPLREVLQEPVSREEGPEDGHVSAATADPTANLTFNLRLSEDERRAKESVPLPYHFSEEKKTSLLQAPTGKGKIYYEPDASDDIDEEDPDDDLDV